MGSVAAALVAAGLVVLAGAATVAPAAVAATAEPPGATIGPTGRISLASQTSWVDAAGSYTVRVDIANVREPQSLELAVTLHQAVRSRSQFSRTLDGGLLGDVLWRGPVLPLAGAELDRGGAIPVTVDLRGPDEPYEPGRPALPRPGVHPVRVELRDTGTGDVLDAFTTHLVRSRDDDAVALAVAWLQPLGAPPALQPDGSVALDEAVRRRLALITRALGEDPLAVTLEPTPETLDALSALEPELVADLRAAIGAAQVLAGPYVDVDAAALVAASLEEELAAQRRRGSAVLAAHLGSTIDPATEVADVADVAPGTLAGVERLVAPEETFTPLERPLTLANPFVVRTDDDRLVEAAAIDPGLSVHFANDDQVLGASHLLADLAVLAYDAPGLTRGVVVRPPSGWTASADFLVPALEGLGRGPVVRPVTLDQLFEEVPLASAGGSELIRTVRPDAAPAPALPGTELRGVRQDLASLTTMAADEGVAAIERLLLVAAAEDLSDRQRREYLEAARRGVDDLLGRVEILSSGSFRLTSREATIPLTVVNDLDAPMQVWLVLESDKLDFVDAEPGTSGSAAIPLALQPGITPVVVPVEARTSGNFPLLITLRSPDGRLEVASVRLTVRSTFLSGVGIALSAGAGLFLCVWWARHWRTARRARRLVAPVE